VIAASAKLLSGTGDVGYVATLLVFLFMGIGGVRATFAYQARERAAAAAAITPQ
jgi:hypothetical protein